MSGMWLFMVATGAAAPRLPISTSRGALLLAQTLRMLFVCRSKNGNTIRVACATTCALARCRLARTRYRTMWQTYDCKVKIPTTLQGIWRRSSEHHGGLLSGIRGVVLGSCRCCHARPCPRSQLGRFVTTRGRACPHTHPGPWDTRGRALTRAKRVSHRRPCPTARAVAPHAAVPPLRGPVSPQPAVGIQISYVQPYSTTLRATTQPFLQITTTAIFPTLSVSLQFLSATALPTDHPPRTLTQEASAGGRSLTPARKHAHAPLLSPCVHDDGRRSGRPRAACAGGEPCPNAPRTQTHSGLAHARPPRLLRAHARQQHTPDNAATRHTVAGATPAAIRGTTGGHRRTWPPIRRW